MVWQVRGGYVCCRCSANVGAYIISRLICMGLQPAASGLPVIGLSWH